MRVFVAGGLAGLALLYAGAASAFGSDLTHRECSEELVRVYQLPDAIESIYSGASASVSAEKIAPSDPRKALAEQASSLAKKHSNDWKDYAKNLRAYCEGLR